MRIVFAFLFSLFLSLPARAGDMARVRLLGFSPGGAYFAFMQSGVQDGSGFSYADIFILDVARDAWVRGTPVRVLIKDETSTARQAQWKAMQKAKGILRKLGISGAHDMTVLAHNPVTELSADARRVDFNLFAENPRSAYSYRLALSQYGAPAKDCASYGVDKTFGFSLRLSPLSGGAGRIIHRDDPRKNLPRSRRCALDYRITHVISYTGESPERGIPMVALVEVFSHGFEGPDGRFVAIPFFIREN